MGLRIGLAQVLMSVVKLAERERERERERDKAQLSRRSRPELKITARHMQAGSLQELGGVASK
jgi:hypothetical protein